MIDKSNGIEEYKKIERNYRIKSNIYFVATLLGFVVGVYGLSEIKDNNILKYSFAGIGTTGIIISSELCHRSLKKKDYYKSKINTLESII